MFFLLLVYKVLLLNSLTLLLFYIKLFIFTSIYGFLFCRIMFCLYMLMVLRIMLSCFVSFFTSILLRGLCDIKSYTLAVIFSGSARTVGASITVGITINGCLFSLDNDYLIGKIRRY